MQPVQITIRDIPNSEAIESHILKKAEKLTQFCQKINSCRVVIEAPQKHKRQGKLYCVHIDLTVPGKEIAVTKKMNEDVYVAIRDAFNALQRQLETYARKHRGNVKTHENVNGGYVKRIMHEEGYGFIEGNDGNEYYFSPTNVTHPTFVQLSIGDAVQFLAVVVSEGLQAHRVTRHS